MAPPGPQNTANSFARQKLRFLKFAHDHSPFPLEPYKKMRLAVILQEVLSYTDRFQVAQLDN